MIIDFPSIQGQRWPAKTGLILYGRACHALAEAKSVDEVKDIIDKTVAVQMYAKQAHNRSLLEDATDIRPRAERRCGALLTEMKATGELDSGIGGDRRSRSRPVTVKLSDLGINKRQSTSYQNLAAMADDAFEVYVVNRKRKASTGFGGSGSYERNTPPEILELVRKVFHGRIDCDPASNAAAQRNVRAKVYYTIDDDGLKHSWPGFVFVNPPYRCDLIKAFVKKLIEELQAKRCKGAILLTDVSTSTQWFETVVRHYQSICFVRKRIGFLFAHDGENMGIHNPQGQMLAYFGSDVERFENVFSTVGTCMR